MSGRGCSKCCNNTRYTKSIFIEKANVVHKGKYIYDDINYINNITKIGIICPIHGRFLQTPASHLQGNGCPICGKNESISKRTSNRNSFIEKAISIYGNANDYSSVAYKNARTKVLIKCNLHGNFWQTPDSHLRGHNCPKCNSSKLELEIRKYLNENNINFIEQYHPQWMGLQSLDFYLPDYKVGIECQGKQHFEEGCTFGGNETLDMIIDRDNRKLKKCQDNGVQLLYYSNLGIEYPYEVFEDKEKLLEQIRLK